MKTAKPRCKICKRQLTNAESIAKGIGPECAQTFAFMLCDAGLTFQALGIPETLSTDPLVARELHRAEQAMLAGRRDHVEAFKAGAIRAAERIVAQ
jgi:hypothetical protein